MLLKALLRDKQLNETYTGGISSFLLFNLVFAYFQMLIRENRKVMNQDENLGKLLVGFLQFYGFKFDDYNKGISLIKEGEFFLKAENKKLPYNNLLCVENFQNVYMDIGKSAYQYPKIKDLFKCAYRSLLNTATNSYILNLFAI